LKHLGRRIHRQRPWLVIESQLLYQESRKSRVLKCRRPMRWRVYIVQVGFTSLNSAAQNGHEGCVKLLLDAKAAVDAQSNVSGISSQQPQIGIHVVIRSGFQKFLTLSYPTLSLSCSFPLVFPQPSQDLLHSRLCKLEKEEQRHVLRPAPGKTGDQGVSPT
jgi:ankyrin repeat protein